MTNRHMKQALKFLRDPTADTEYILYKTESSFGGETKHLIDIYCLAEDALAAWNKQKSNMTLMDGGHWYSIKAIFQNKKGGYHWWPSKEELQKLIDEGY